MLDKHKVVEVKSNKKMINKYDNGDNDKDDDEYKDK